MSPTGEDGVGVAPSSKRRRFTYLRCLVGLHDWWPTSTRLYTNSRCSRCGRVTL